MCDNRPGARCAEVGPKCIQTRRKYEISRPHGPPVSPLTKGNVSGAIALAPMESKPQIVDHPQGTRIEWRAPSGVLHRDGGPAVYGPSGERLWYCRGRLHNTQGPAVWSAHEQQYWVNGMRATPEQFLETWAPEPIAEAGSTVGGFDAVVFTATRRTARTGARAGADYYQVVARTSGGHRIRFNTAHPVAERNRIEIAAAMVQEAVPQRGYQAATTKLHMVRFEVLEDDFTDPMSV